MAFGRVSEVSFRSFDFGTEVSEFRGEPWAWPTVILDCISQQPAVSSGMIFTPLAVAEQWREYHCVPGSRSVLVWHAFLPHCETWQAGTAMLDGRLARVNAPMLHRLDMTC